MSSCRLNSQRSFASIRVLFALCIVLTPFIAANAQGRLVSCGDPRVKDALTLAIMQRYQNLFSGVQARELGWIGAGHAGFAPNGDNICKAWVNFQTLNGRVLLAGTAQFEVHEDASGNVVASLL